MIHTISTTMQPDQPIEVDDTEYLDLKRQGLIAVDYTEQADAASAERDQTPAPTPPAPEQAAATAPATTSKAAKTAANKEG